MTRRLWMGLIGLAFGLAAFVTVQVNRMPHFAVTPMVQAELASLLRGNGLDLVPMGDPPGMTIDAALRFAVPTCTADGFVLPLADTHLTDVQAARFTEITGASYQSNVVRIGAADGILKARRARVMSAFRSAFGLQAPRHGHTLLVVFMPAGCDAPLPDLSTFWSPVQGQT